MKDEKLPCEIIRHPIIGWAIDEEGCVHSIVDDGDVEISYIPPLKGKVVSSIPAHPNTFAVHACGWNDGDQVFFIKNEHPGKPVLDDVIVQKWRKQEEMEERYRKIYHG